MVDGWLSNGQIVAGKLGTTAKGYPLSYDAAGQRISSEQWSAASGSNELCKKSEYYYNNLGQLTYTTNRTLYRAAGANNRGAVIADGGALQLFSETYNAVGNRIQEIDYDANGNASTVSKYSYRGDGTQLSQLDYKIVGGAQALSQATYFGETGMIDAAGRQLAYRYVLYNTNGSINYRGNYSKTYAAFETYKDLTTTATWTLPGTAGVITSTYSDRGELLQTVATGGNPFTRRFASTIDGQLLARQEANGTVQNYLYNQGQQLASVGNAAAPQIIDTIDPISTSYPGRTPPAT